jgi:hypothetical protein
MNFSISGPRSSSGTPGEFEIFYRCRHPRTTPPAPIPGVGWEFLSEGLLPPAVVGHRVPLGDLRFPPRLVGGKLSPDTGTATVQVAVENVSCASSAIVALQAIVKDERGTKRFTNMVEVKFRSPLP